LKILYVGQLAAGSTCAMRLAALRSTGLEVEPLDSGMRNGSLSSGALLARRVCWRLGWPLDFEGLNTALVERASASRPDVIWVDKGNMIHAASLRRIRRAVPRVKLLHFNPDDPFGHFGIGGWRPFLGAIAEYDMHFVPRRQNVSEYQRVGARKVAQVVPAWGFAPEHHRPVPIDAQSHDRYGADVGFIGSFEEERARDLLALAEAGLSVRIVGPWPKRFLAANMLHTPQAALNDDYARALCSFKVALGFLRKNNRDQHTSRSIEIPACGAFMLAERSEEHLALFAEGREAEYFSTPDELISKASYYLAHPEERERIAAAGLRRCVSSGYSNRDHMVRMLQMAGANG
jgi:spore maturation protein CgeB